MEMRWDNKERRRYIRIEKHFIISYYEKNDPHLKHNISQLKNISMGGMCFVSDQKFARGIQLGIQVKTPYLADMINIEGTVLEPHEKVPGMIYETRLSFDALSAEAEFVLKKIVETFSKVKEERGS